MSDKLKTGGIVNAINRLIEKQGAFQPVALNFTGGITPHGAYNAGHAYVTGDSVSYSDGCSYVAIQATTGNLPTNTTYWQKLADKGSAGAAGAAGTNSVIFTSGAGVPTGGADGDWYLRTSNGDIYKKVTGTWTVQMNLTGPTGATGATGAAGSNGTNGADGITYTWRHGAGAPGAGLGINGDFYLNDTNQDVYAKSGGAWGSPICNIKGATGATGDTGAQGAAGEGLSGGTLSGELNLGENAGLALDTALSADGKYSGITEAGTAGAALAFGDLCYLAAADSRWELCDANAEATAGGVKLGICVLAAAGDGSATKMLLYGKIRADAKFPTLTISAPVYIGETAGTIVVTQPTTADVVIRRIGHGNTADELYFAPDNIYVIHT